MTQTKLTRSIILALATATAMSTVLTSPARASHLEYTQNKVEYAEPTIPWNGVRIFLAPSDQEGNIGCESYQEANGAHQVAHFAARELAYRGYRIAVGHGTPSYKASASTSYGANWHIPIHSNAGNVQCVNDNSRGGTQTFYYPGSASGAGMARSIWEYVAPQSPGAGTQEFVAARDLIETRVPSAPAAYIEVAFHTVLFDKRFMSPTFQRTGELIVYGIENYLGYPR